MELKIIILISAIAGILILALFGVQLKQIAIKEMVSDLPEYNCGDGNLCTSCIIEDNICSCGEYVCKCFNMTIDKNECNLF